MNTNINTPIFADLSTYTPIDTIPFYEQVFGWEYYKEYDYYMAYLDGNPVAGLYETPEKFKQMRMPHFWMTYIQVENVDETVRKARELGGIIEMNNELPGYGNVALIRDPQGAGFTIYQGDMLQNTRTKNTCNTLIWNELHVSDLEKVIPFYRRIFDWEIHNDGFGMAKVYNKNRDHVADIMEISNELKGKYEYWISSFGVRNLSATKEKIIENGGSLVFDEGERILFTDNSGQSFFYVREV